ncbi:MAG TPA: hypothetical protein VGN20_17465 [Mucilaginibacter sp.]|jgi:hypothetical protein
MKSKQLLTLAILSMSICNVFGQDLPRPITHLIKKLHKKGADTILIYTSGCGGCEIKNKPVNCNCLDREAISDVYLIFKLKGELYREEFTCCKESNLIEIDETSSIPYFLSLKDMLKKKDKFYSQLSKNKQFLPPISTDSFYEQIVLVVPDKSYEVGLNASQRYEDYKIWKQYFWVEDEIKLVDFVRKDLGMRVTHTSTPID